MKEIRIYGWRLTAAVVFITVVGILATIGAIVVAMVAVDLWPRIAGHGVRMTW